MDDSGPNTSLRLPTLALIGFWAFANTAYGVGIVVLGIANWRTVRTEGFDAYNGPLFGELSILLLLGWIAAMGALLAGLILGLVHLISTRGGMVRLTAFTSIIIAGLIGVVAYHQMLYGTFTFTGYYRFFSWDVLGGLGFPLIATTVLLCALALLTDRRQSVVLPATVHQP